MDCLSTDNDHHLVVLPVVHSPGSLQIGELAAQKNLIYSITGKGLNERVLYECQFFPFVHFIPLKANNDHKMLQKLGWSPGTGSGCFHQSILSTPSDA